MKPPTSSTKTFLKRGEGQSKTPRHSNKKGHNKGSRSGVSPIRARRGDATSSEPSAAAPASSETPPASSKTRPAEPLQDTALLLRQLQLCEEERDFYYEKLRCLEVFIAMECEASGQGDHTALVAHQLRAILFGSTHRAFVSGGPPLARRMEEVAAQSSKDQHAEGNSSSSKVVDAKGEMVPKARETEDFSPTASILGPSSSTIEQPANSPTAASNGEGAPLPPQPSAKDEAAAKLKAVRDRTAKLKAQEVARAQKATEQKALPSPHPAPPAPASYPPYF